MHTEDAYLVEHGIPRPSKPRRVSRRKSKYPFADMKVDDSFEFPMKKITLIQSAIWNYKDRKEPDSEWVIRPLNGTKTKARVWRVK